MNETDLKPVVFVRDGRAFTNSRRFATFFRERHSDVVGSILGLVEMNPSLAQKHFVFPEEMPDSGDQIPNITVDIDLVGFTLLCDGSPNLEEFSLKMRYVEQLYATDAELRNAGRGGKDATPSDDAGA
jgi:hypothetical protein